MDLIWFGYAKQLNILRRMEGAFAKGEFIPAIAHVVMSFFVCPKKDQKKTSANDMQHICGIRPDWASVVLLLHQLDLDTFLVPAGSSLYSVSS